MSTPAIIYIIITLMTLALWGLIHNKSIKVNVWANLADVTLLSALLYWGGFFS